MADAAASYDLDYESFFGADGDPGTFGFPTGGPAPAKRSRGGSKTCRQEDGQVPVLLGRQKTVYTFKMKRLAVVFGRTCTCCSTHDTDRDPVSPDANCLWGGYKMNKATGVLETEGATCWHCFRVWNVIYMVK